MKSLEGKVALVTGAARGQGRAHAVRLAREGAAVVAVDICKQIDSVAYPMGSREDLDVTGSLVRAEGAETLTFETDVRDHEGLVTAVTQAVDRWGRLDIVVANAGIASLGEPSPASELERWRDIVDVNLTGAWYTARSAIPHILEGGRGGSIVFISSVAGLRGLGSWATGGGPAYSASKHGIVGMMQTLAADLGPHSIRVNSLHPSGVDTPMINNDPIVQFLSSQSGSSMKRGNALPIGNLEPMAISDALMWLVSDAAQFITGVALPVDAGYLVK
jgi:SDR family mycofactocin-dependent oxidoreductase